jgi:uncharacterized heparinase superfamily protein
MTRKAGSLKEQTSMALRSTGSLMGGLGTRWAMGRALRALPARGFVAQPEPRTIGLYARGRQLIAGNALFGGQLIEVKAGTLWDIVQPDPGQADDIHGFSWLDDLAAVGDAQARTRAQNWLWDWIARYGAGRGPGWSPDLTGRRLIRWINHALFVLSGRDRAQSDAYYAQVTAQTVFLSWRWQQAAPGLPRFEALVGLVSASLALVGMEKLVGPAVTALSTECGREVDAQGGIPTRNPEELLEVFTLLTWAVQALNEAGQMPPEPLLAAIERITPTLRALRHADGGLARFHSGGRGLEGRLDQALAAAAVKPTATSAQGLAMGFARLQGGRTSVVIDASTPPAGLASALAHASTLAFELTSGRRPLIVSCGSGAPFGPDWRLAGRATASHSTLALEGFSSSRFKPGSELLTDCAGVHHLRLGAGDGGPFFSASHDGWAATHGLSHLRTLTLSADGRRLIGQDALTAATDSQKARFERLMTEGRLAGVGFALRFHLHPDVDATLDMGGNAVSIALKSGEIWVFRHNSQAVLSLDASVYLQKGRLKPRAARQIVLSGRATAFDTPLGWTLAKAQDTALAIRDLDREEMPVPL